MTNIKIQNTSETVKPIGPVKVIHSDESKKAAYERGKIKDI